MQDRDTQLPAAGISRNPYSAAALARLVDIALLLLVGFAGIADGLRIILTKADAVGGVPAGGWIVLLGALLVAGTCGHAVREIRAGEDAGTLDSGDQLKQPVIALAMLLIYIALIEPLGYTLSTALFMAVYLRLFGKYGVLTVAGISIAFAFGSSWLWAVMDMMLPQGPLPWP